MSYARRLTAWRILLIAILALAVALRFYGQMWDDGFGYTPHPDERAIFDRVIGISPPELDEIGLLFSADESPWNPGWFNYGSFPLYALKTAQILGAPFFGEDADSLRILGRSISAIADIVTILAMYGIAALVFDRRTGLLAAALTSLAVIHIQLSHFFAVDTIQAMFAIAALYFMVKVARECNLRHSLLAGALIGLGFATKASQLPIIAPFIIAHLMFAFGLNGKKAADRFDVRLKTAIVGLAGGGAVAALALLLAQPYSLLDWSTFLRHVSEQSEMVRGIRDYPYTRQYADTAPYLYHIRQLTAWGYGLPLGIAAWAGLLYISLRGMPLKLGFVYLIIGWALPASILLLSNGALAVVAAAGISLLALFATLLVRSKNTQLEVLLLCWVVPYFLITGAFHVKFMRYMLPIAPLLALFGSRALWALWDSVPRYKPPLGRKILRPLAGALIALVLASTAFYAFAYVQGVYGSAHTAVRANDWLNQNAPSNSFVLKEHWEESLPYLRFDFRLFELPLYEPDRRGKIALVADMLEGADYLVLFSNRLYGTIPRLPERYPITSEYYRMLFSEQLGYTLARVETSYPTLFGVTLMDDTLGRPNLPAPPELQQAHNTEDIALNLGYADESFSVYDHPKVLIFENTGRLSAHQIQSIIDQMVPAQSSIVPELGLMYSPDDATIQQNGGAWTDIIRPASWTNRLPLLAWLGALELAALIALPLTFIIFRPLHDRGYLLGKTLGILLIGLIVWLLTSLQWMAFSRTSIVFAAALLAVPSLGVLIFRWQEIIDFVRRRWAALLVAETIFIAAFLIFVLVRMANPDLWHTHRGGEKPMDLAYLNAVMRSTIMPPYDPWFGGGYLNYYYWGQFLTAVFIRITAIEPVVAFNLAVPTFFALTVGGAYTVVYNLVESAERRLRAVGGGVVASVRRTPVLVGLTGAAFVTILGNLDGAIQVGRSLMNLLLGLPISEFDFWRSSRMMPPDPPGHEITEFPFFTFLFADLHAHMMVIPFTLLVMGLALAAVLSVRTSGSGAYADRANTSRIRRAASALFSFDTMRLVILGISVGALAPLNTWDLPTYLIVAAAAILFAEFLAHGGLGLVVLLRTGVKFAFVAVIGFVSFLPYHLSSETFYNSVQSTTNTTILWQFLAISGLFVFIIATFAIDELANGIRKYGAAFWRKFGLLQAVLNGAEGESVSVRWLITTIVCVLLFGFALTAAFTGVVGSTVPFVLLLAMLLAIVGIKILTHKSPDEPQTIFALILALVSLSLVIGLDFLRVEGDIARLNSIFKFYMQVWVMLGIASAYLLWRLFHVQRSFLSRIMLIKRTWVIVLAVLLASAVIYPIAGTRDRLRDRFNGYVTPLTLNGIAFIQGAAYTESSGDVIELAPDYEGIRWLQLNVEGSPIVLEAVTPEYRWGSRVSIHTGLPSVVGWQWHQEQQRWGYRHEVARRVRDVRTIYTTRDPKEAIRLLRQYGVEYVYLGELERAYFPRGMHKFEDGLSGALDKVFDNGTTTIYRVKADAPP